MICSTLQEFSSQFSRGSYSLVVSNPPYIPTSKLNTLEPEITLYEDSCALDGGKNGLSVTVELLSCARYLLQSNG